MSYDIHIWSVTQVSLPDALPEVEKWRPEGLAWVRAFRGWQIVVNPPAGVLFEDVPEDVAVLLPGIHYLTELNLEPAGAPMSARQRLISLSRRLARTTHGVVLDPQTDQVTTPAGVRRYRPQRREDRFSILALSWWFTKGPLLTEAGLQDLVGLLERRLPEAMPRRYGLFEPPQHQYAETGREHFLGFLQEHLDDVVVWYPHRPVAGVSLSCSPNWGAARQGFRTNTVRVEVEAIALEQPGWPAALEGFWRAASQLVEPFYGDVRTLDGFLRMGPTHGSDVETGFHPVRGPWWMGIPRVVGHAAVLGEPYLALWPRFVEASGIADDLAFLSTNDWRTREEVSDLVGGVPDPIAQRWIPEWTASLYGGKAINWNTEVPPVWPFEKPGLNFPLSPDPG